MEVTHGLKDKNIILGVSGGIAAYKSVELLRLMTRQEAAVRVVMTPNAQHFVGWMTFQALSGRPVCTSLFEKADETSFRHIDWATEADAVVIAPASADLIGKLANGIADDALTTMMMVVTAPVVLCPSMNTSMYRSRAVQRNLAVLRGDGYSIVEPEAGDLACGTVGPGRLPEPPQILDRLIGRLTPKDLKNQRVLVTAGPTREPIDPVRFISNPSTGKMGFAVARAAEHRGAGVTLITGPTVLANPAGVDVVRVQTAAEMGQAVLDRFPGCDIVIKTAAVSDYRPQSAAECKIKKGRAPLTLELEQTEDILKELGRRKTRQILVGFAAETEELEKNAPQKLAAKNLDIIVGNLIGPPESGFESDTNRVTLFFRDGSRENIPAMDKFAIAHIIFNRIVERAGFCDVAPGGKGLV
ncbi:MAG: bifunctional phosphopantothenoylcysteine decarboxylase/phosphopantothenate--cysteine ligase CoaBC [Desulfobacterales bacterium]|jgi:phosphopantothenoylcysteine decarboxylase / phosphopantothenate---cysteine ligase